MESLKQGYRPNVGLLIFNADGLVFVGERLDSPGAWQCPQGGIDKGEAPATAALRELAEEIGTNNVQILREHKTPLYYDFPPELTHPITKHYKGQAQFWFALKFLGSEGEIKLETADPEFARYQWVPLAEIIDLAVPFKREVYRQVVELFKDLAKF